ncbi:MAG TPA: orotate phosphoribosyltransferase [Candidatus Dormibacteraeota bacterium]|nr:orotate phosphoribosyltransferase [Candidatus Dormibacteraeota bacterium]
MNPQQIQQMLERVGAVRHGHFVLSSGRHSATYVQCALVLAHPELAETLGKALAERFAGIEIDVVISLALGGLILGHEVARALGVRALFVERNADGQMALRRQFQLQPDERVLVIEDVWTTGKSTRETIEVVEKLGGQVAALGSLVDRSGGRLEWEVPAHSLLEIGIPNYESDDCPLCRSGDVAVRPGSRFEQAPKPGSGPAQGFRPGEPRSSRHR